MFSNHTWCIALKQSHIYFLFSYLAQLFYVLDVKIIVTAIVLSTGEMYRFGELCCLRQIDRLISQIA
ncbi:hypothetical protein IFVP408_C1240040 [Vibrio parahaemolyticus]